VNKTHVYVVDDDEVIRLNIVKKLSRLNCFVQAFESGESLIDHVAQLGNDPDLILLDYKMGGMNGMETLRALRTVSQVPVILFTAYKGWIDMDEIKTMGSCEVMLKTVDLNILECIVSEARSFKKLRNIDWVDSGKSQSLGE